MARPAPTTAAPASRARGNHPAGRALPAPAGGRPALGRAVAGGSAPILRVVPDQDLRGQDVRGREVPGRSAQGRGAQGAGAQGPGARRGGSVHAGPVRLTRRGRAALGGLVVAVGVGLTVAAGSAVLDGDAAQPAIVLAGESSLVVRPGDTLWSIAVALAPDSDPRAVVDALQEVNRLDGVELVPGQVLVLP